MHAQTIVPRFRQADAPTFDSETARNPSCFEMASQTSHQTIGTAKSEIQLPNIGSMVPNEAREAELGSFEGTIFEQLMNAARPPSACFTFC
jgi:hypothetical protein